MLTCKRQYGKPSYFTKETVENLSLRMERERERGYEHDFVGVLSLR